VGFLAATSTASAALARRHADDRNDSYPIQEALNGKPVDWMEKVSDEQYQRS